MNYIKVSTFARAIFAFFFIVTWIGANAQENKTRLIEGWKYRKEEIGGIYEVWRDKKHDFSGWTETNLPHCINAFDAVDPDMKYYQGETWYRSLLNIENPYPNGRTLLHFEGAGQKTKVYSYLTMVQSHVGGYDEFTVDMTESFKNIAEDKLFSQKFKGKYPVAICTDNSRDVNMMPSDLSDFNLYGGLYRYVNLLYVPAISAKMLHIQSDVKKQGKLAIVKLHAEIYNPENFNDILELAVNIKSPKENIVYSKNIDHVMFTGKEKVLEFSLNDPLLWSPETPNLYICEFSLKTKHGEHKLQKKFGLRYFEFKKHGAFYLNGKRLLLRGTHRHEDHAGVGAAMTEDMIRNEMQMMKDMGVNFIRLAHYQQSQIVLDCCDEMGILVWEEIPWCRGGIGNQAYKAQGKRMLANMINQHYNHPAVIIWGLGNENDWPGDFETFDTTGIINYMTELNDLSHQLDDSRKTAIRRCDFCKDIVDVYSPSIWAGWYRGKFTAYKEVSEKEMKTVDHFLHVEWGASNHAGRHSENPDKGLEKVSSNGADERDGDFLMSGGDNRASRDGEWSETYACNLIDWHLKEQETMDWLTGTAYWPFKDFSTPVRPFNPVPYVNQKGVVERDFTKKEAYYVFQSYWTDEPMVHIYGHSWETRWGKPGELKVIKVYSNCSHVELIVNGEALLKKTRAPQNFPAAGLRWTVNLKEGENIISAVGYKNNEMVKDEIKINYQTESWGEPAKFKLTEIDQKQDTVKIKAEAFDVNGIKCLDATNRVRFKIAGDGRLIENLGTSSASKVVQLYNGHAYISLLKNNGISVISVSADGIPTQFIEIK